MSLNQKKKAPVSRWRVFAGICCFMLAAYIGINAYLHPADETPYQEVTLVCWEDADTSETYVITDETTVGLIEAVVEAAVEKRSDEARPMSYPRVEVYYTTEQGSEDVFRIDASGVMNIPGSSENYMVGKWQSDTYFQLLDYLPESE